MIDRRRWASRKAEQVTRTGGLFDVPVCFRAITPENKPMLRTRDLRENAGLAKLIYRNAVQGEREVAYFRLFCVFIFLVLTLLIVYSNIVKDGKMLTASDIANIICLGCATAYTVVLLFLIKKYRFIRVFSFFSSTIDVLLVSITLYLSRFAPDSSIASIPGSPAFVLYTPVILFSLRRHDPLNSLYTGLLSSAGYLVIIVFMAAENSFSIPMISATGLMIENALASEFTKVTMLAIAGLLGYITAKNYDMFFVKGLKEQKEKERIRNVFGRYVSDKVVDRILSNDIPMDGEKRVITVMFIDVKNFTTLSESVDPKLLIKILNRYFSYCLSIISRYDGFVDKFIGDAIMIEFGAPIQAENHRENAVNCAIELCQLSHQLEAEIQKLGLDWKLEFGIGINSGEVILGNVGTSQRMEYTALGDVVNTASRIEGLTRRLNKQIVVGSDTYTEAIDNVLEDEQLVALRGKAELVKVYAVKL